MKNMVAFCLALLTISISAQDIRVATYNLRYDTPLDSINSWPFRYHALAGLVLLNDFDIFGTQEGLKHQLEDLKNELPGYDYIGVGRDDGFERGEHSAIFYKTGKFKLLAQGNFWLSPVTDKPSTGWDAALPRICTWGEFRITDTGKTFFLFNLHFDHKGDTARKESTKLVITMIRKIAGNTPTILTGDFNFDETHENYSLLKTSGLLSDTYDLAGIRFAPGGTFNGFNRSEAAPGRIDHIFVTPSFRVLRYGILNNTYSGRYPSDHFPVFAQVLLLI
jgi:endonuclease/exonuclease/phosphatase family metal-dependent hydrolase